MVYQFPAKRFSPKGCLPIRAVICVMMFTACWTSYTCRLQMSILAVPMIYEEVVNGSSGACAVDQKNAESLEVEHRSKALNASSQSEPLPISGNGPKNLWTGDPEDLLIHHQAKNFHARYRRNVAPSHLIRDSPVLPFSNKMFDWGNEVRGRLIFAYNVGNIPGNLLGGILAIKYGPRAVILWTSILAALVSFFSPHLANIHWTALLVARFLVGITGGMIFPCCHTLVARWAPPTEKSRFVWSLLGGTFGTIFTYPMVTAIAEMINWESGWYLPSLAMMVWIIFWWALAYDSPAEHPGISEEEKNYILTAQSDTAGKKTELKDTPVKAILTSIPFISLILLHYGNSFLLIFYQNTMMIYLTKALGFQLTKGGFLASLPWIGRLTFGFFFSWVGDMVRRKEYISLTLFRKCATIFSHLIPGVFLILVGYVGCDFTLANLFLFFALGFNGAAAIANLSNNQDLSPNYAGFLYGIMNTVGTSSGIIVSSMVEVVAAKHHHSIESWQIIFSIGAAVCITSMVIFSIGGSAKIQPWNEPNKTKGIA